MLCNIFFKVQITYSLHHHQLTHLSAMQNAFYIGSTNFQIIYRDYHDFQTSQIGRPPYLTLISLTNGT